MKKTTKIPTKIFIPHLFIPHQEDFIRCLNIINKAKNIDDGFIDWSMNYKKFGYTSGEAFIIISLLSTLILELSNIAFEMDKKNKKYE